MKQKENVKERFEESINRFRANGSALDIETLVQFTVSSHPCLWKGDRASASYCEFADAFPELMESTKQKIQDMGLQGFREHARTELQAAAARRIT